MLVSLEDTVALAPRTTKTVKCEYEPSIVRVFTVRMCVCARARVCFVCLFIVLSMFETLEL